MTFPDTLLPILVELQMDSVWTDISTYVRYEQGISISRGRPDEGGSVEPSKLELTLDNRDGRFSPRVPTGPYFGLIGRNTPIRVSIDAGDTYLKIADVTGDKASTPDHASLDITGDIDVRFEGRIDDWRDEDTQCLIGKYNTTGNQRSWRLLVDEGFLFYTWSTTGADFIEKQSTVALTVPPSRRMAVRVTHDVSNGGNNIVTFYTADTIDGPWTILGDPVTTAGATSIFASTATLDVGQIQTLFSAPVGEVMAAQVYSGIDGTAVANPDFTAQTSGATSFADAAGRTWTVAGNASITNRRVRFAGEVTEWPPRWDTGGFDVVSNLRADGLMRRLSQGAPPLQSTLRRRVPSGDPVAYWPLEDGVDTTRPASAIDGVAPLNVTNLTFAADDTFGGSDALPVLGTGLSTVAGSIPGAASGGWHFEMVYRIDGIWATEHPIMTLYLSGAGSSVAAVHVRAWSGGIRVQALDGSSDVVATNVTVDADAIADFASGVNRLQLFSYDDGPDTHVVAAWRDINNDSFWFVSTSFTGAPGKVTRLGARWHADLEGMAVGHMAVFDTGGTSTTSPGVTIYSGADDGFAGETALNRMDRIVTEGASNGTSLFLFDGDVTLGSEEMGGQNIRTYMEILRECEEADHGILYERRDRSALVYRDRSGLYNQTPKVTIDYEDGSGLVTPLDPVEDDQNIANDVTVERTSGSFAHVILEEGALSIQAPPNGIGSVEKSENFNLHQDEQCEPQAGWLLHLGTVDELRYPRLKVLLQNVTPSVLTELVELDIGDLATMTNLPSWLPPDDVDLLVQGYDEYFDQKRWEIEYKCTPGSAFTVAELETSHPGLIDTAGSELAFDAAAADTELVVAATAGKGWVRASPAISSNPRVATDLTGWSLEASTIARAASPGGQRPVEADWSIRITPDGVTASGGAMNALSGVGTIVAGQSYTISCWAFSPGGWSDLRPSVHWYDAAGVFLSTSGAAQDAVTAGTWVYMEDTVTAPANASQARVRARHGGTPAATNVWYATQITIRSTLTDEYLDGIPFDARVGGEVVTVDAITGDPAYDTFTRTESSGWGFAEIGGEWSTSGGAAADYSCNGTQGVHTVNTLNVNRFTLLPDLTEANFDLRVDISTEVVSAGGAQQAYLVSRFADTSNYYGARVEFTTTQTVTLTLIEVVAGVGTSFTTFTSSITHVAGTPVRLRFQGRGTTLRAKVWLTTDTEPGSWQVTQVDASLSAANQIGCRTRSLTGMATGNDILFDNFISAQTFTVTREVNTVEKAQSAGEDIRLNRPAIVAL